jgi:hypothetical protein
MNAYALRVFGTVLAFGSVLIGTCAAQDAAPASTATVVPYTSPATTTTTALPPTTDTPPTTSEARPPASDPTARHFADMDDNRDGTLTQAEYETGADARFATLDTDRNNRVSAAEVAAAHPVQRDGVPSAADRIRALDQNTDGELTDEEMRDGADKAFIELDADKDGALDLTELRSGAEVTNTAP